MESSHHATVVVIILMILTILIFSIVMYMQSKKNTGVFSEDVPPTPKGMYVPAGKFTKLTEAEIKKKNKVLNSYLDGAKNAPNA